MKQSDIANIRLVNQQIAGTKFKKVKDVVKWMCAIQAQDYAMAKWAIGARLPGSSEKLVESAIDKGKIIRTHLLRPTWHFVSSDDIYWMLELTAHKIKTSMSSRHKELELNRAVFKKSNKIFERVLSGGNHLSREELKAELERAKISTGGNRLSHILANAELDGLICSGVEKRNKHTYALLAERVSKEKTFTRDEALAKLAKRYFESHCPATLKDYSWWSGLSLTEASRSLEMVKSDFIRETIGGQTYWLIDSFSVPRIEKDSTYLLPAFDEFIISYKDRTAALPFKENNKSVFNNGMFKPVILFKGRVIGIWKRTIRGENVILETEFFNLPRKTVKKAVAKASAPFGNFLDKTPEIIFSTK